MWRALGAAVAAVALSFGATAQEFPTRNITVVSPYAAGGGGDIPVRWFADRLQPIVGKPVIVLNKPGGNTGIGASEVAHAKPDGHTILATAGNSTMVANTFQFKKLQYDPERDFAPVTTLWRTPFILVVGANSPVNSVAELSAHLKKKGKAHYGRGVTVVGLVAAEQYKSLAGIEGVEDVAYKDLQPMLADLKEGAIEFVFMDATTALQAKQGGQGKLLAVTPSVRAPFLADLPTMEEAGVKGYELMAWFGVYAPAGAPAPIVNKLSGWFNQVLATEEAKSFLTTSGTYPFPGNPESLAKFQASERAKWGAIFKKAKLEPQ
jgi:tripartite-type tricarboxylate transporter receptor subunit TctC